MPPLLEDGVIPFRVIANEAGEYGGDVGIMPSASLFADVLTDCGEGVGVVGLCLAADLFCEVWQDQKTVEPAYRRKKRSNQEIVGWENAMHH